MISKYLLLYYLSVSVSFLRIFNSHTSSINCFFQRTVNCRWSRSILDNMLLKFLRFFLILTLIGFWLLQNWIHNFSILSFLCVFFSPQLSNLEVWFQRPKDIVRKLLSGDLDLGIVGLDTVSEFGQVRAKV